jgi:hypothetical protein
LQVRCTWCDFDWESSAEDTMAIIQVMPDQYRYLLDLAARHDGGLMSTRSEPTVWSVLEYVAHTRDTVAWYQARIHRVLTEPLARLEAFDWDRACEERRYRDEAVSDAVDGVVQACHSLSELLLDLGCAAWTRTGLGSDGGRRTVLDLAQRAAHEIQHHLNDVERLSPVGRST